jgi:hypothetical protein
VTLARRLRRTFTRQRLTAVAVVIAVVASGLAILVAAIEPPARVAADEVDGRTWLGVGGAAAGRSRVVLVNGISGFVEAQAASGADTAPPLPGGLSFAGSDRQRTLLAGPDGAVLLADGSHDAQVVRTSAASSVLAAAGVVTVGRVVAVRPVGRAGHLGAPQLVVTDGVPSGAAPVVDGSGRAWVLLESDTAVRVDRDGRVGKRVGVAPLVSSLTVVDGVVYAVSPIAVRAVDRSATLEGAGDGGVVPSVGIATGGTWAVARGTNVALVHGGSTTKVDVGATVRALAIWHGDVWAAAGDRLTRIHDGVVTPVPGLDTTTVGGELELFGDGGRLWVVSPHAAVSIDRDQEPTVFTLAAVDVDLCVGDCSTQALLDYLGAAATSTTTPTASTVSPTRSEITLPPNLPTTTTISPGTPVARPTSTTSTVSSEAPSPASTPAAPTTSDAATPATADPAPPPAATSTTLAGPTTSHVEATTTVAAATSTPAAPPATRPPGPPVTRPPATNAPSTAAPTAPATSPPTSATLPPTTAPVATAPPSQPPADDITLVLGWTDGGGPTVGGEVGVTFGWRGDPAACPGATGAVAAGTLSSAGASSDTYTLAMAAGDTAEQRFAAAAGELTVTLQVCGRSASITRAVIAPAPVVGAIVAPAAVAAGEPFTASAPFVLGAGWSPTGATWAAGTCGGEAAVGGSLGANATVSGPITFADPGAYCVTVVVSFRHELGNEASSGQSTGVVATPTSSTTTSTSPATSTSSTTTSTSVAPTTTPTTTVVSTTAPPTTAPTTTVVSTTVAPATTTTAAPTPITAVPTTAAPTAGTTP